jgi:tannase
MTIVNETIRQCDVLDGKTDDVVARTELCKTSFNISTVFGKHYKYPATAANPITGTLEQPALHGTARIEAIKVATTILDRLHDSISQRVYVPYQPTATFADAQTLYNSTSQSWQLDVSSLGGEWVERWIKLLNASNLPNLDNVTVDTLKT